MIGKLTGLLDETGETYILLNVGGVGYIVYVSAKTMAALPLQGQNLSLYIETQMREDAIRLYGFLQPIEQEWFRLLQNVQGVGAKLALAILGSLTAAELSGAVAGHDIAALCRAPGVGKKVAERLANELKNKMPADLRFGAALGIPQAGAAIGAGGAQPVLEAVSALTNLGYRREEAERAVAAVQTAEQAETAEIIRAALVLLAKK